MHVVGRSLLVYSRSKESTTEKLHAAPSFYQNLTHEYSSSSSEANLKEGRTTAANKPTERNKDLSVIALIKPAASGFKNLLHTAANQFSAFTNKHGPFCCAMNTRETSNSSQLCPCISPLSASHRWATSPHPTTSLFVAIGDYDLFFTSGVHRLLAWSLRRPPKLEATKRHPVGHLHLIYPWPVTQGLLWSTWFTRRFTRR